MTMRRIYSLVLLAVAITVSACEEMVEPGEESFAASRLSNQDLTQVDRFGLPAVATVFIPSAQRDAYNTGVPAQDRANWKAQVVAVLTAFGNSAAQADALSNALLPDVQPLDVTQPSGFLNGRRLQDDVITAELMLIFGANAALNDDHVDANDVAFLNAFPWLAGPHQ